LVGLVSKNVLLNSKNALSEMTWKKKLKPSKITMIRTSHFELQGKNSCENYNTTRESGVFKMRD